MPVAPKRRLSPDTWAVVVALVFAPNEGRTKVVGLDARDIAAPPLFVAKLKHHIPYSLHGTFTPHLFDR